ncbi:hypothetical protein JYU34_007062 [Plutella xylostella]|uniref:ACB domain-containing protein n=1 Tax=Plutella xylostella TaxID=51655 RepID=A0ABQ7QPF7_PLUXY|nr:hypothetical protein JYU34_007062 [Plutella xylostella]
MSLDEQFKTVSDTVKNWSKKPSNDENLALYSLFKQANFGDVNIRECYTFTYMTVCNCVWVFDRICDGMSLPQ